MANLYRHLHPRMDRADHQYLAGLLECDIRRRPRGLGAQVEFIALARRHDVVGNAVVVEKGDGFTLLDCDFFGRERTALLADRDVGGERPGGEAEEHHHCERR